jgi:phosphatidate phosphatase APP1
MANNIRRLLALSVSAGAGHVRLPSRAVQRGSSVRLTLLGDGAEADLEIYSEPRTNRLERIEAI